MKNRIAQINERINSTKFKMEFIEVQLSDAVTDFGRHKYGEDWTNMLFGMQKKYKTVHLRLCKLIYPYNYQIPARCYR